MISSYTHYNVVYRLHGETLRQYTLSHSSRIQELHVLAWIMLLHRELHSIKLKRKVISMLEANIRSSALAVFSHHGF